MVAKVEPTGGYRAAEFGLRCHECTDSPDASQFRGRPSRLPTPGGL